MRPRWSASVHTRYLWCPCGSGPQRTRRHQARVREGALHFPAHPSCPASCAHDIAPLGLTCSTHEGAQHPLNGPSHVRTQHRTAPQWVWLAARAGDGAQHCPARPHWPAPCTTQHRCLVLTRATSQMLLHIKAAAWAKPSQGQALVDGFGSAWHLKKPKPPRAKPKPRPNQA
ncbi:hypothetical protein BJV74DRAFT_988928 [Russula compacta]|nr:hypothetical protein BJV74DRAFT_988928 [Russula compacta]